MKSKIYRILSILLLTALSLAFTACSSLFGAGQEERQLGIDGYVYVPEQLPNENKEENAAPYWIGNFRVSNGYLYYTQNDIYRIPLNDNLDFSSAEPVLKVRYRSGFTVDQEQNLYCCTSPKHSDAYSTGVPSCITVSKYSPEGVLCYQLPLPNESDANLQTGLNSPIAVDAEGNVLLLTENGILKIDKNGSLSGKYTLDDTQVDSNIHKYLLQCRDGQIYYVADNYNNASREVYCITGEASPEITLITSLSGYFGDDLYEGIDGLLVKARSGIVSKYRFHDDDTDNKDNSTEQKGNSITEIFCFEDVDMIESDVDSVVQIDQNRFLAATSVIDENYHSHQEFFLMTKTSVEELPEKEMIILASLFPTDDLKRTVIEFNKASDKYHVSIESYGATESWEDNEGAYTRLDSSLVSGNKPDLLDLAEMDIYKYAESGTVADLTPYIEQSSVVRPEQYLENLQAGYTIDGKLICLPRKFYVFIAYGYDERVDSAESWTMENVMAITDNYPDTRLLPGIWNDSSFMLEDFCAPYYLEAFIDWENGNCSFECNEFYRLLEWIKKQLAFGSDYEGGILGTTYLYGFDDYWREAMKHGTGPALLGFPSAEGSGNFLIFTRDALCMVENSSHPEGAWAFLEYYMSHKDTAAYDLGFPSLKEDLNARAEDMVTPTYSKDYEGNLLTDMNGNYIQQEKWTGYIDGEPIPCYVMEQSHVDAVLDMINSLDFTPRSALETSIVKIVTEEAEYYFNNSKSAEAVAEIIQNRVQNLIQESR